MTYEYAPRRRFNMPWIITLIIAGATIFSYIGKRSINPVTGEKQYVDLNSYQEKALGLEAAPKITQHIRGVLDPRSEPRAALVQQGGQNTVSKSDAARSRYAANFHLHPL